GVAGLLGRFRERPAASAELAHARLASRFAGAAGRLLLTVTHRSGGGRGAAVATRFVERRVASVFFTCVIPAQTGIHLDPCGSAHCSASDLAANVRKSTQAKTHAGIAQLVEQLICNQ